MKVKSSSYRANFTQDSYPQRATSISDLFMRLIRGSSEFKSQQLLKRLKPHVSLVLSKDRIQKTVNRVDLSTVHGEEK